MKRKSQFECDADVEQHFVLMAALSSQLVPPPDLWEKMEQSRRVALSKRACPTLASAPEEFRYEPTTALRRQLAYPMNEIREVVIAPVSKRKPVMPQQITRAPRTLATLVERAGSRKRKQK